MNSDSYENMPAGFLLIVCGRYDEWRIWTLPTEHKARADGYTHRLVHYDGYAQDITCESAV